MIGLDEWWAGGQRLPEGVFTRADGDPDAPAVTWLHGFPISSWDWAKLHEALGPGRRDVTLDFLGFGASAKPAPRPADKAGTSSQRSAKGEVTMASKPDPQGTAKH